MARQRDSEIWTDGEWIAVDSTLEYIEGWASIDRIAAESDVKPNVVRAILKEMVRHGDSVVRKGKRYRYRD
ncbi:MAG: hypothetical protein CME70_14055 [Halobacteriovorax sp.]|nr:hypothetical protein [Halobacteriovorax sp.]|tara:strand:- start:359 stop:571 length:213 start_codon:yes stop_codon:yes gene_type:complete